MLLMPIFNQNSNKFSYTITLDGVSYFLNYYWNAREENWYLDICDVNQNPIITNRKLVVGFFMLSQWRAYPVPPGDFIVLDSTGKNLLPITLTSLGSGIHQLFYIQQSELLAGVISGVN